jgi:hypothetical protein
MPSTTHLALAAAAAAALAATAARAETPISVEGHLGSPGIGLQMEVRINDYIALRGGGDWYGFRHGLTASEVRYNTDILWATGSLGIDIHPLKNPFFISGGGYFGDRKFTLHANPDRSVTINGRTFTADQIGHLDGEAKLEASVPFVGVGWDTLHTSHGGFGWKVLAGAVFSPEAKVTIHATGPAGNTVDIEPYLQSQRNGVRHSLEFMRYYPLIQIGAGWRF